MKTKVSQTISTKLNISLMAVSVVALVGSSFMPAVRQVFVSADQYDSQVSQLQQQNSDAQKAIATLQQTAASYQDTINNLQSQINTLQASISANTAQQASLQQQIIDDQNQIDIEKAFLASDVKAMYVDGTPSTLEVLATSKNLSDFVDKQEYRTTVQNKIQDTLTKIAAQQKDLNDKKAVVDQLLNEQRTQEAQVASDQSQQQGLLNLNEGQQADYTNQVKANNAALAAIQRARAAAIARITGSGGRSAVGATIKYQNFHQVSCDSTGYSYCWAGFDQNVSDPWGLGLAKECVHFAADWLARHGHNVPHFAGGGGGNADHWAGYGTIVSASNVQVGDVAYMPLAPVGHVGIVTAINGDGTFHITQMNWPVGGYASEMDLYPQNVTFIRF